MADVTVKEYETDELGEKLARSIALEDERINAARFEFCL
jgi:hypothetical protein